MSELRWILLGFGIFLLASIYLWGRRSGGREGTGQRSPHLRNEESTAADDFDSATAGHYEDEAVPLIPAAGRAASGAGHQAVRKAPLPPPTTQAGPALRATAEHDATRRLEPTFDELATTVELVPRAEPASPAPTLSSAESKPVRRVERRKILSLRLSVLPERIEGATLLECLLAEALEHGKYSIFHRQNSEGAAVFSVASMVEPGTFDLDRMAETLYPGITLFAQLPGPVAGMHALNDMLACGRRLQQALGGVLQDERGVPLTVHRVERMRQEVREFERPAAAGGRPAPAS
jgi:cell division protein ZipA